MAASLSALAGRRQESPVRRPQASAQADDAVATAAVAGRDEQDPQPVGAAPHRALRHERQREAQRKRGARRVDAAALAELDAHARALAARRLGASAKARLRRLAGGYQAALEAAAAHDARRRA